MNVDELATSVCALGRRERLVLLALIRENPELGVDEHAALADFDRKRKERGRADQT